ncbi:MAG: AAA family ATPase [Prevotella sp.]|nr:AAA family ATPase [Prevotella sp.]
MGIYINKGNTAFRRSRNSEYVDKSGLIAVVNQTLFTERCFTCVTRSRRFGKSMAAKMLAAYYDHSCDSRALFSDLKIAQDPTFEEHLNKYPVIYLDLSSFTRELHKGKVVERMEKELIADIRATYTSVPVPRGASLMKYLLRIHAATGDTFIFIIDEWDAILRECAQNPKLPNQTDEYLNWLRSMFKDVLGMEAFAGVYITGILPIKKYDTQSALNNFQEYSMVKPGGMGQFFGFTKDEVRTLAGKYDMDFDELEKWYDGYQIGDVTSIFNPNSVMTALREHWCESYWGKTGATDAVADYISRNFDGLKDNILSMLAGERCYVEPIGFRNDMAEINTRDDVLTVLIHLGYLAYDRRTKECYVPNMEVSDELKNAVRETGWTEVAKSLEQSRQLLDATLRGDAPLVARMVQLAHIANASLIKYSDENSMSCVLAIAYYYAHGDYIFHREYQTGTGFGDLVMMPRKNVAKPAIIVELKYNDTTGTAIDQIHQRQYPEKVAEYTGDILLVAISYDKKTKEHTCQIETYGKTDGTI